MFSIKSVQCLRNKTNELELLLDENKLDFLCINEHWFLNDEISYVCLNNYKFVAHFTRTKSIHGGVAIYCLKRFNCYPNKQVNNLSVELHCEIVGISYSDTQILTVYRPPNGDFNIFLEKLSLALDIITNKNNKQ